MVGPRYRWPPQPLLSVRRSGDDLLAGVSSLAPVVGGLALLVGAVLVGTALANVCLPYKLVGVDTT
ncbi:YgaP family membrane protein [Halosimplex carlsbadense]|uniref:YgaP family membrane protein n=1 Tax=Halosimplex carlsbadense TaxID=171164 RepID=UPI0019553F10|nr:DUF2892 domain-containing protein [Halosimplex carlsbadense]